MKAAIVLTISRLGHCSIKYYNDAAHQAKDSAIRHIAGGGLAEYYSEGETRIPSWLGTPKSRTSTRKLPMPDEVVDVLHAARTRRAEERLAFGSGFGSEEYVASDETGQPYHPNLLTFRWGRMLDELGISRVRLHDARHSCATLMHLRQVPIAVIAAWLGHASAAFTLSVYAHSQNDALKADARNSQR
jgi:integrase